MKKLIITSALIISALFTYAEKETKSNKVKSAYEILLNVDFVYENLFTNTFKNDTTYDLIDIRPFIKPEKEIEEDTEFINALSNRMPLETL